MAHESLRLQRLFDDADLPVLFVKGAALAMLAFGNLGPRSGQDIVLLVAYETLPAAMALTYTLAIAASILPPISLMGSCSC